MEPFFLRCETCQARLRVRDERFLGQIQSCPKCGSMVQIIAPAGWLAQGEATQETPPELTEVAASTTPAAAASAVAWLRSHTLASTVGATSLIAACGLAALLALRGDEQVALLPTAPPVAQVAADEASEPTEDAIAEPREAAITRDEPAEEVIEAAHETVATAPSPVLQQPAETRKVAEPSSSSFLPLITPPAAEPAPVEKPEEARKLTLEPVEPRPHSEPAMESTASTAEYPPDVETESTSSSGARAASASSVAEPSVAADETEPPLLDPPARRTNVMDQLAVPIQSITLPDVPIGEFVGFVSTMTAVPIELDAKVLGEVGLSSRSTVTVHGEDTTAGKLLARVLKEHQLTCIERDGTLVVVRAMR